MSARPWRWGKPVSDAEFVLEVLREAAGQWVDNLYQRTHVMCHSRISDLRKKGYVIESQRFGHKDYRYRLVSEPAA